MPITDLVPWKKSNHSLALRRQDRDPFAQLRQNIDEMFDRFLGNWTGGMNLADRPFGSFGSFMPEIDVTDTGKEVRIVADLPGMEQKDINVSFLDGSIAIKGEKRQEHEEEKGDVYRCERQYGAFERTIPLPGEVDPDKVRASFKNGVLKITLPKTKEAQTNRKMIPVQTS
jgi:HSP20 family protein